MIYKDSDKPIVGIKIGNTKGVTIDNQSDKYLFSKNKTIGFRKDKKLNKFVGLRDGKSKTMEFTIKSIIVDGVECIDAKKIKFTKIDLLGDVVVHKLNKLELFNRIDSTNYRHLVKVDSTFNDINILYVIDLKGIVVNNDYYILGDKKIYIENGENQFNIVDDNNKTDFFIIDRPIIFNSNNDIFELVNHELFEIDGILYYKKYINDFAYKQIDNNISLPVYIDANIIFDLKYYYTITKSGTLSLSTSWEDFISKYESGTYKLSIGTSNIVKMDGDNVDLSRHYFSFDTTVFNSLGDVSISGATFNYVGSDAVYNVGGDDYLSLMKATYLSSSPSLSDWSSISNIVNTNLTTFSATSSTSISIPNIDINKITPTNFALISSAYDKGNTLPPSDIQLLLSDKIINSWLDVDFSVTTNEKRTLTFKIDDTNNSFGVLSSKSTNYNDARSGSGSTITIEHTSINGTYSDAFSYIPTGSTNSTHEFYRTFLSFDTSLLSGYYNNVIRDVRLKFNSIGYKSEKVAINRIESSGYTISDDYNAWNMTGTTVSDNIVNNIGVPTIININKEIVQQTGSTSFILINEDYDKLNSGSTNTQRNGIDFSTVSLEVDLEPYLVQGLEYKQVIKGDVFTLSASVNFDDTVGFIRWYSDSYLQNQIGSGNNVQIDSNLYHNGDIIYAVFKNTSNTSNIQISYNRLEVKLEIIDNIFDNINVYKREITDNAVDIDSVYFKYENAVSGICYSYFRDLKNIYEQNINVSDGDNLGCYNMYNEFDLIDEFYSNVFNVDVAYRLDYLDLSKIQKHIDGVEIKVGTTVLLYSKIPSVNDGIYEADSSLHLIKTDLLSTQDKAHRGKVNIKYGSYADYEFHTYYYVFDEINNNPSTDNFDFSLFDSSLYNTDIIVIPPDYVDNMFNKNN